MADEACFRQRFAEARARHLDVRFLCVQTAVVLAHWTCTTSPAHRLLALSVSVLPLVLHLAMRHWDPAWRLRTASVVALKLLQIAYMMLPFTNDFVADGKPLTWLGFFNHLTFITRAVPFFGVHVGLQLPVAVDLPLMALGAAAMLATAVPRQCGAGGGTAAPPGTRRLAELAGSKFAALQLALDWPFHTMPHNAATLALGPQLLCEAVCSWVLLVGTAALPAAVLWAVEGRERAQFQHSRGRASTASAGRWLLIARDPQSPLGPSYQLYTLVVGFIYVAELLWCIIRVAVVLHSS